MPPISPPAPRHRVDVRARWMEPLCTRRPTDAHPGRSRSLGGRIHACAESRLRTGIEACAASHTLDVVVVGLVAVVGALILTGSHPTEEHPAETE